MPWLRTVSSLPRPPVSQPPAAPAAAKAVLRARVRERLRRLTGDDVARRSRRICLSLRGLPELRRARLVAGYLAMPGEVCIDPVLRACRAHGLRLLLPRFDRAHDRYAMVPVDDLAESLRPGHGGIREPRSGLAALPARRLRRPDVLWLVPGLAFDRFGGRLGRGRGYFDRLLAGATGPRVGVAFACQLVARVPGEPHDVPMHQVLTERGLLRCRPGRRAAPFRSTLHPKGLSRCTGPT